MHYKNAFATTSNGSKIVLLYINNYTAGLIGMGFDTTNSVFTIPANSQRYWWPEDDHLNHNY